MNILLITPLWGYGGGVEQYATDCIREFHRAGHRCSVVFGRESDKPVPGSLSTLVAQRYEMPALFSFETPEDTVEMRRLNEIIEAEKPDIVFGSAITNFTLLARLATQRGFVPMSHNEALMCMRINSVTYVRRSVCTHKLGMTCLCHGCFVRKEHSRDHSRYVYNSLDQHLRLLSIYRDIGVHLVASTYMQRRLMKHGFNSEQVTVVGYFTNLVAHSAQSSASGPPIISFVGRVDRYKGVDYLLRALKLVSQPFHCLVSGDGDHLESCKNLASRLGLTRSVDFIGWMPTQKMAEHLSKIAVATVPSIFPEPFGIVGIEAMTCAKPVVGSNTGGITDWLLDNRTGYLTPRKDPTQIALCIDRILKKPDSAVAMGAEGRRYVLSNFSKELHFQKLFSCFERAVERRSPSALLPVIG